MLTFMKMKQRMSALHISLRKKIDKLKNMLYKFKDSSP